MKHPSTVLLHDAMHLESWMSTISFIFSNNFKMLQKDNI